MYQRKIMVCPNRKAVPYGFIIFRLLSCLVFTCSGIVLANTQRAGKGQSPPPVESRVRLNVNAGWKFHAEDVKGAQAPEFDDVKWAAVSLPHTWNVEDTQDDVPGYRQGVGWYKKSLELDAGLRGKRLFLRFEGANQVAEVFVNGRFAGLHEGGYAAFAFDVTDLLKFGANSRNVLAVKMDNSNDKEIPPSPKADFNLYGGIYRDVWLVATDPLHITVTDYASPGVYIDTPVVSEQSATVRVRGTVTNDSARTRTIRVSNTVLDAEGRNVSATESNVSLKPGERASFQQTSGAIAKPLKVYSNLTEVELLVNGKSLGVKRPEALRYLIWDVPFRDGLNTIEARGRAGNKVVSDRAEVRFIYTPPILKDTLVPFTELAVDAGSNVQFIDGKGTVWEPDRAYIGGGWGFIGGEPNRTNRDVLGTADDALYQTARQGLKAYRFDVPDGSYEVELGFVEQRYSTPGARVFNVTVNGRSMVSGLDLVKEYGAMHSSSRTLQVKAAGGQGVIVEFTPVTGEAVVSAILIRRLR